MTYDVIVIGGGPAGYPAAIRAAQNKLKVACIDEWKNKDGTAVFGGTCTNAGCIPSKALLESSELYHKTKDELGVHGIKVSGVEFDVTQMQKRKTGIIKASTTGIAMLLKGAGVTPLQGHGKLLANRKVEFAAHDGSKQELSAKHIVLASGSIPTELKSMPFDGRNIVDSWGALDFESVPKKLAVVGAGARTIVPDRATAAIDLRLVKETPAADLVAKVRAHIAKQGYHLVDQEPDDAARATYPKLARFAVTGPVMHAFRTSASDPHARAMAASRPPVIR